MNDQAQTLRSLRSPLAKVQAPTLNIEGTKQYGWQTQGILVVKHDDPRLNSAERDILTMIGARLYGRRHAPKEVHHG